MTSEMNCPNCQADCRVGDVYCWRCGVNLTMFTALSDEIRQIISGLDLNARLALNILSFCAPSIPIPEKFFFQALETASGQLHNDSSVRSVLKNLVDWGLVYQTQTGLCRGRVTKDYIIILDESERKTALHAISEVLASHAYLAVMDGIPQSIETLLPHLPVVAGWAEKGNLEQSIDLWSSLAAYWFNVNEYQAARCLYELSYNIARETFGDHHEVTAVCMCNLAKTYRALDDDIAARRYYENALSILLDVTKELDRRPDDRLRVSIAIGYNDLGLLLRKHGNLDSAKKCLVVCQGLCKSSGSGSLAVTVILLSLTLRITA